jgi:hypothetical protein
VEAIKLKKIQKEALNKKLEDEQPVAMTPRNDGGETTPPVNIAPRGMLIWLVLFIVCGVNSLCLLCICLR